MSVAERLAAVRERIGRAAQASGRAPDEVRLLAVSKFHGLAAIREAYAAGQREFGENYAQELAHKAHALSDLPGLRFRFIGGLQRNKTKLLAELGCAVETIASIASARALAERAAARGLRPEVMIQVNVCGERQKSGIGPDALPELARAVRSLSALELSGLMTLPPADDPTLAVAAYRTLRELAQTHGLRELSMGMSDDLELAIAEGATRVRVGTAIFGPRPAAEPKR